MLLLEALKGKQTISESQNHEVDVDWEAQIWMLTNHSLQGHDLKYGNAIEQVWISDHKNQVMKLAANPRPSARVCRLRRASLFVQKAWLVCQRHNDCTSHWAAGRDHKDDNQDAACVQWKSLQQAWLHFHQTKDLSRMMMRVLLALPKFAGKISALYIRLKNSQGRRSGRCLRCQSLWNALMSVSHIRRNDSRGWWLECCMRCQTESLWLAWLHSTFNGPKDLQGWLLECWKRRKSGQIVLPCMPHRYRGTLRWCCFREGMAVDEPKTILSHYRKVFLLLSPERNVSIWTRADIEWTVRHYNGMLLCSPKEGLCTRVDIEWSVL